MKYYCALGHERFQPDELLKQATAADHLAQWWTDETAPTTAIPARPSRRSSTATSRSSSRSRSRRSSCSHPAGRSSSSRGCSTARRSTSTGASSRRSEPCCTRSPGAGRPSISPRSTGRPRARGQARRRPLDARRPATGAEHSRDLQAGRADGAVRPAAGTDAIADPAEIHRNVLMNVSAGDPEGAIRVYGDQVIPNLKSG